VGEPSSALLVECSSGSNKMVEKLAPMLKLEVVRAIAKYLLVANRGL